MSPEPATPTTPTQVPATSSAPAREDATAQDPRVLQESALNGAPPDIACIADKSTMDYSGWYFEQVYFVPRTSVRFINSRKGLVAMILAAAPAKRLILMVHSQGDQISFPESGETVPLGDLAQDLLRVRGKFSSIVFDGCTLGTQPSSMFRFAETLRIEMAMGWTHSHAIGYWTKRLTGRVTSLPDDLLAEMDIVAPWFPLGELGSHETAAALAKALLRDQRVVRAFEVFNGSLVDLDFPALVAANSFNPSRHFPRSALKDEVFSTLAGAEAADNLGGFLGQPYRRLVVP